LRSDSPTFGYITSTPKEGWIDTDIVGRLHSALNVPVAFDTDVNAAGLAEWRWGAAQGLRNFVYLTVGTGIGGGGMINGALIHGLVHPEMGHVRIPHDRQRDPFAGRCPFHGDCLEGLASGPALAERWGTPPESLAPDHPAWELEAEYLALALVNFICTLSPERIVLGGGVLQQEGLYQRVREKVLDCLNNYVRSPAIIGAIDDFIVPPSLGNRAGVLGAIALGQRLLDV
jgi:fructokinase